MPISSFYGLQTVAARPARAAARRSTSPATTSPTPRPSGYSRQEAQLAASPAHLIPAGGASRAALGAPRLGRRRPELPPRPRQLPRPPVPRAGHQPRRSCERPLAGARPRASSRSPSPATTASTPSSPSSGTPGRTSPTPRATPAARQALRRAGAPRSPTPSARVDAQLDHGRHPVEAEYADLVRPAGAGDPGGEIAQIAKEIAHPQRHDQAPDDGGRLAQRPARPPRPAARPALRATARSPSSRSAPPALDRRSPSSTRDARDHLLGRGRRHRHLGRRARGDAWAPGGRLGALLERRQARRHARPVPRALDTIARLADLDRQRRLRRHVPRDGHGLQRGRSAREPRARRLAVVDHRGLGRPGRQRHRAQRRHAARRGRGRRVLPRLRRPRRRRRPRGRRARPPTAGALTDAVDDRRQSVVGRLDGRGDDQPGALPARLPGLGPRHERRWTRCSTC